jgi:outer membrane lipoprotein LolB
VKKYTNQLNLNSTNKTIPHMFKFFILAVLIFLSACSNLSTPTAVNSFQPRQYHQQIDLSGRLSVQYEQNNKPQAIHTNFDWSQTPQQTTITLGSPTGQTLAMLLINAQGAQLNQGDKPPQFAVDANQLMLNTLGWPLPVAGLRDWLQGFIDATHRVAITSANPDTYFLVDGWMVSYTVWENENAKNNTERPKRIDLKRQTEQAGLVSIRIVIDEWNRK